MKLNDINNQNEIETESDNAAASLAEEMLQFIAEQYHAETDAGRKLELALRYSSTIRELQKVKRNTKRSRARWSRYPGRVEKKEA